MTVRYKQSLLSWGWIFLMPFVTMLTFLTLNVSGVLSIGQLNVPYPIFGLLGVSIWNIFANGLAVLTTSVNGMGSLIGKINFAKSVLIFSSVGQVVLDFLIRLLIVLVVFLLYGRLPSVYFFLFPLYILPLIFLTTGLGFFTSILQVIFKDTQQFINLGLSFFLFLMPIMYTFPSRGFLYYFNKYNPIFFLISVPRDLIIFGHSNDLLPYAISSALAVLIFFLGWIFFYLSETKLAERI
jgi:ABC-type polysaccharide/polyol phosphate export permease